MRRMMRTATFLTGTVLLLGLTMLGPARAESTFRAPESIRVALRTLNEVVIESGRLIAAGHYDALALQTQRFEAGVTALQQGLGEGASPLQKQLEPLLARARVASNAMSEAAGAQRISMLPVAHRQLAQAVTAIIALFPPDLRPADAGAH